MTKVTRKLVFPVSITSDFLDFIWSSYLPFLQEEDEIQSDIYLLFFYFESTFFSVS